MQRAAPGVCSASTLVLALSIAVAALSVGGGSAHAQASAAPMQIVLDRQPTTLSTPATRLFATSSGTLFVFTAAGVMRSDDGATTWQRAPIPDLPPNTALSLVTLDSAGNMVAYAGTAGKATFRLDHGDWRPLNLPDSEPHVSTLSVSPADPNVLYALTSGPWPPTNVPVGLYRSRDAGATWQLIDKPCGPNGTDGRALFAASGWIQPDATDPQRVFRSVTCTGSIGGGAPRAPYIDQSRNQGDNWSEFFRAGNGGIPTIAGDVLRVTGNFKRGSGVFLITVRNDFRGGGSSVFRSVDDGKTWKSVLGFEGGVATSYSYLTDLPNISDPGMLGFVPANPEQIVIGGAWASADGGQNWGSVAGATPKDMAMTANDLFAATDAGVVRLSVRRFDLQLPDVWHAIATDPSLQRPVGLTLGAVDGTTSSVFVAYDAGKGALRTLGLDGSVLAEWAPLRAAGVAATADGQGLFATDEGYPFAVRELLPDQFSVVENMKQSPQGIAVDPSGVLYVGLHSAGSLGAVRLMQLSQAGDILNMWSDSGTGPGQFGDSVWGVALDAANNMYVADTLNDRVQELASDGTPVMEWAGLHRPYGVAVDADGNVYVADTAASRIVKFAPDGTQVATWGDWGTDLGHFRFPMGVAVDSTTGTIYVADTFNDRLVTITSQGQ